VSRDDPDANQVVVVFDLLVRPGRWSIDGALNSSGGLRQMPQRFSMPKKIGLIPLQSSQKFWPQLVVLEAGLS
jgi:hypothetical protein